MNLDMYSMYLKVFESTALATATRARVMDCFIVYYYTGIVPEYNYDSQN